MINIRSYARDLFCAQERLRLNAIRATVSIARTEWKADKRCVPVKTGSDTGNAPPRFETLRTRDHPATGSRVDRLRQPRG